MFNNSIRDSGSSFCYDCIKLVKEKEELQKKLDKALAELKELKRLMK